MGGELEPGWVEATDPSSGKIYYANPTTGGTTWEAPLLRRHNLATSDESGSNAVNQSATALAQMNTTSASALLLLPEARRVVDSQAIEGSNNLELEGGLTVGQLADLCLIQREGGDGIAADLMGPYTPLHPYGLPVMAKRPPTETGRLEMRIHSLYDKLKQIR